MKRLTFILLALSINFYISSMERDNEITEELKNTADQLCNLANKYNEHKLNNNQQQFAAVVNEFCTSLETLTRKKLKTIIKYLINDESTNLQAFANLFFACCDRMGKKLSISFSLLKGLLNKNPESTQSIFNLYSPGISLFFTNLICNILPQHYSGIQFDNKSVQKILVIYSAFIDMASSNLVKHINEAEIKLSKYCLRLSKETVHHILDNMIRQQLLVISDINHKINILKALQKALERISEKPFVLKDEFSDKLKEIDEYLETCQKAKPKASINNDNARQNHLKRPIIESESTKKDIEKKGRFDEDEESEQLDFSDDSGDETNDKPKEKEKE